jgi:predicted ATPase
MKTPQTNWYVITGGPSSGKSTVIRALQDMGYKTTLEAARHYIDLQRMNGRSTDEIRANQRQFQHKVLNLQIDIEKRMDPKEEIFFDRALPDEVAYYKYFNLEPDEKLTEYLKNAQYKKIFIMDLLPLDADYARTEDREAQVALHNLIIDVYQKRGEPIVFVPVLPVKERVKFILDHLDGKGMA